VETASCIWGDGCPKTQKIALLRDFAYVLYIGYFWKQNGNIGKTDGFTMLINKMDVHVKTIRND